MAMRLINAIFFVLIMIFYGCSQPLILNNTARWREHPQFGPAVQIAPDLMQDILSTTTRLEEIIEVGK